MLSAKLRMQLSHMQLGGFKCRVPFERLSIQLLIRLLRRST